MKGKLRAGILIVFFCLLGSRLQGQAGNVVQYFYDDLGRLSKVIDPAGNTATYTYDAVGNILSINRSSLPLNNALTILGVSPTQGKVGQSVTLRGQGFSTTPASNLVKFNGISATVSLASSNQLTVIVPSGASTGQLTVSVAGVTAQGGVFTVLGRTLASLFITPVASTIRKGDTLQFLAHGTFDDGLTEDVTNTVNWNSSDPTIASISNAAGTQGLAKGVSATGGNVTIVATSGTVSGSAPLQEVPPTIVELTVTPAHSSLAQGATQQFAATTLLSDGTTQNVTTTATWSSSDATIATISNTAGSQGLATAVSAGAVTLTATFNNISGTSGLLVNPATQSIFPRFAFIAGGDGTVTSATVNPGTGLLRNNSFVFAGAPGGGAIAVDPAGKFVFIGNGGNLLNNNTISVFSISGSGSLSQVSGSPFATGANPIAVAVHPSGNFLYVANHDAASISAYAIDPVTGSLTATPGSPFVGGGVGNPTENPSALAIDPSGKYLLVAEAGIASVAVYTINQTTGDLAELANSPFASGGVPISVAIESHGKFAFVANDGDNDVSAYALDPATGTLTPVPGSPFLAGGSPESVATDASGKFVYVANTGGHATISAYTIDSVSGSLTEVSGSPFTSGFLTSSLTADPSGRFLYAMNGDATTTIFGIDPNTGALASLGNLPSRAGTSMAITSGTAPVAYTPQFAYVANSGPPGGTNNISGYSINSSTGVLSAVSGSPFAEGFSPTSLVTDPLAPYLYVTNKCSDLSCTSTSGSVSAYVINPTAGSLSSILSSPFAAGTGPLAAAVDPSGRFAYAVNNTDNTLSAYTINSSTGALAPMIGSPFAAGLSPQSVAIDSTGLFLYVLNSCSDTSCATGSISAYTLAPDTGVPAFVSTTLVGKTPTSATIEPTGRFAYVVNQGDGTVSEFSIDRGTGSLGPLPNSPFTAGLNLSSITADPLGRFAFATAASANDVVAYTIDPASGVLSAAIGSPFSTGVGPISLAVDTSGKFLYVVNGNSNSVSAFSIDPVTGALTSIVTSPFPAGSAPNSITTTGKVQ